MASPSFAFVPRNISKNKKQQGTSAHVPSPEQTPSVTKEAYSRPSVVGKGKEKAPEPIPSVKPVYNEEDTSILVVLAFSDYALWIDSDLRRKTEESLQREEHDAGCMFHSFLRVPDEIYVSTQFYLSAI